MSITNALKRIAGLEAAQQPLQRAYALIRRGVPPKQWPNAELESFCAVECADMRGLSDAELEQLAEDRGYDDGA